MPKLTKEAILSVIPQLVLLLFVLLQVFDPKPVQMVRMKTFDLYQHQFPRAEKSYPIYVIDVDEKSLAEIGQFPWPRSVMAGLVEQTFEQGAAGLAFDMVFAEPDGFSPENVKHLWDLDQQTRDALGKVTPHDIAFSRTLKNYPVVAGMSFLDDKAAEKDYELDLIPKAVIESSSDEYLEKYVKEAVGAVRNLPGIEYNTPGLGHFYIDFNVDSVARSVPMLMRYKGEVLPSLSLELLRIGLGEESIFVNVDEEGIHEITVGDYTFPTDKNGSYWIHFRQYNVDRYVSASDVINNTLPEGTLAGKLAIVGTSALGLFDLRSSPLNAVLPGVDIHMQAVETILKKEFLYRPSWSRTAEILFVLFGGIAMMWMTKRRSAVQSFIIAMAFLAVTVGSCLWAFKEYGYLLDAGVPLIALMSVFMVYNFVKYAREEASKREIRKAFGHYLSRDLVDILTEDTDSLSLGGEKKEMTILFSDIRSFTTISEGLGPEELTTFINEYLTPMTDLILRHQGTIDKYMGDAIMAFWNAPLNIEDHAYKACLTSLEMMQDLKELNVGWAERGLPPINIGIGLNTGDTYVGNMGSNQRFDYTVLGDSVNLAARLESSSKMYGASIVVSQCIKDAIGDRGVFMPIDFVIVKGKTEPIATYALLGLEDTSNELREHAATMEAVMASYKARKWTQAQKELDKLPDTYEVLKNLYKERIATYKKTPPPKNWDGSYTATSK